MQKIHDMLGRMGELAVMANDDTKSDTDKDVLQKEFAQMQDEIARIVDDTNGAGKFNGIALFAGATITQQVGADGGQEFTGVSMDLTLDSSETLDSGSNWGDLVNTALADSASGLVGIGSDTEHDAGDAVALVSEGIDFISDKRADIGAEMQRMEQTLDGLRSYEENITATESRIRDVDVASETAEMSKYNILQQVGTAMLAQANSLPQGVLQLLG
jgi:flagellin